jgi:hypothetical protein
MVWRGIKAFWRDGSGYARPVTWVLKSLPIAYVVVQYLICGPLILQQVGSH